MNNNESINNVNYGTQQTNQNINYVQQPINNNYNPQNLTNQNINNNYTAPSNNNVKAKFDFKHVFKNNILLIGCVGALIAIIGCFLTFAVLKANLGDMEFVNTTVNYFFTEGEIKDGAFIAILSLVSLILICFKKSFFALISNTIASLILIADIIDINNKMQQIQNLNKTYSSYSDIFNMECKFGLAPFIVGLGLIVVFVHVFLFWKNKRTENKRVILNQGVLENQQVLNQNVNYAQQVQNPYNNQDNFNQF